MDLNALSEQIIGSAITVHRAIGPGLLESAYEECLCRELSLRGIRFSRQHPLLLINFNVPVLRSGIKRIVNRFNESSADSASPR